MTSLRFEFPGEKNLGTNLRTLQNQPLQGNIGYVNRTPGMTMRQNPVPPVNIPIATKIGSEMGGAPTPTVPTWDPIGFDNHSQMCFCKWFFLLTHDSCPPRLAWKRLMRLLDQRAIALLHEVLGRRRWPSLEWVMFYGLRVFVVHPGITPGNDPEWFNKTPQVLRFIFGSIHDGIRTEILALRV